MYLAYCEQVDADVAIKKVKLDDPNIHLVPALTAICAARQGP